MKLGKLVARLGDAMLAVEEFHPLLQEATEEIAATAHATFVSIHLDQCGSRFEFRYDKGGTVPPAFSPHIPLRLAPAVGERSQLLLAEGANAQVLKDAGLRFLVVAPVRISRDEELVLSVGFAEPGKPLAGRDLEAIESIASVLALGASRNTFQQLAVFDPATRLYNRRWLETHLPAELERARRYGQPLALLALDVDHFKAINDEHGHPMGDRVLGGISTILRESIRASDFAVRVGGDEFLVLFTGTGASGAQTIASRILDRVRNLSYGDAVRPLRVTVSGGVAVANGESTVDSILREADEALYRAKHEGRDLLSAPETTPIGARRPYVRARANAGL